MASSGMAGQALKNGMVIIIIQELYSKESLLILAVNRFRTRILNQDKFLW